jgi:hypothetical protein
LSDFDMIIFTLSYSRHTKLLFDVLL